MRLFSSVFVAGIACVILFGLGGNLSAGIAGEREWVQIVRPLDIPAERLERPRPEQDRLSRPPLGPLLSQAEVIKLAKAEAKKELGKRFNDYEVKSVIFDSMAGLWSVIFDRDPSRRVPDGCIVVFVHDNDKTVEFQHCA